MKLATYTITFDLLPEDWATNDDAMLCDMLNAAEQAMESALVAIKHEVDARLVVKMTDSQD